MKKVIMIPLCLMGLLVLGGASSNNTPQPKITICHIPPGNPENVHTITISVNALQAHLAHGDSVGECCDDCQG